jgi:hypothetical protein
LCAGAGAGPLPPFDALAELPLPDAEELGALWGAGAGADDPPPLDDEELDESWCAGEGAGELPPPEPPPGPGAGPLRVHCSELDAGPGEDGCTAASATSRTAGDTAESTAPGGGEDNPGPANIAPITRTAPSPGGADETTTLDAARSRGRLVDGSDTTHPHAGQVRTDLEEDQEDGQA